MRNKIFGFPPLAYVQTQIVGRHYYQQILLGTCPCNVVVTALGDRSDACHAHGEPPPAGAKRDDVPAQKCLTVRALQTEAYLTALGCGRPVSEAYAKK